MKETEPAVSRMGGKARTVPRQLGRLTLIDLFACDSAPATRNPTQCGRDCNQCQACRLRNDSGREDDVVAVATAVVDAEQKATRADRRTLGEHTADGVGTLIVDDREHITGAG